MSRVYFKKAVVMFISFVMLISVFPDVSFTVNAAYENTHVNTGNQRADIVAIAQTQVGYHEGSLEGTTNGSDNYTKYNVELYKIEGSYKYMWCQSFIAWCAKQADVSSSVIKRTAGTVDAMDFFKAQGAWKERNYTPQRGDIIYFYSSSSNSGYHVGIVESVSGSTINTIEGNYSNKVARHSVEVGSSSIVGYGVPKYNDTPKPGVPNLKIEKNLFSADETVNISFDSIENTEYYFMSLYRNGELYINKAVDTLINLNLPAGNYLVYISANNQQGNSGTASLEFKVYDKIPNVPDLKMEKNLFSADETVNISFDPIENTEYYFMSLYRNGELYKNEGVDYLIQLNLPAGNYTAYISANNNYGNNGASSIKFNVYDKVPNAPALKMEKNLFSADETVNISFDSIENTEYYFMSLYRNGELYKNEGVDCSIKLNLPAGDYIAYISANNNYGNNGASSIKFKVYETAPDIPKLKINKTVFLKDEDVNISFNPIENTEWYFMSLYRNGELYINEGVDNSINLKLPVGNYKAYVSANNDYGNSGTDSIEFSVIENGDVNSDGDFNISDVVLLQKWLLAVPDTELAYWKAADLCEDGRLDVFDLCLMKRILVENS